MELKYPKHSIQNLKYIVTLWNLMGQFMKLKKKKKKKKESWKQLVQKLKWNFMQEIPLSWVPLLYMQLICIDVINIVLQSYMQA